jgi:hypothetical protein
MLYHMTRGEARQAGRVEDVRRSDSKVGTFSAPPFEMSRQVPLDLEP